MCGLGKGLICGLLIAIFIFKTEIAGHIGIKFGRTGCERGARIHHSWQILIIHLYEFSRLLRNRQCFSHHKRDLLANEAHTLFSKNFAMRNFDHAAALAGIAHQLRCCPKAGSLCVRACENAQHTAQRFGFAHINALDQSMGAIRAQIEAIGLIGKIPVRCIFSLSCDQPEIFAASFKCRAHRYPAL